VKKQQQHALFVLTSHNIDFKLIDIADPSYEEERTLMVEKSKPNSKGLIVPPQLFNEEEYCGVRAYIY
jgi:glutaredoxin